MSKNKKDKKFPKLIAEKVIKLIPGHIYWKDTNGVMMGCNLQQARDLGLDSPEEIVGKTDYDFFSEKEADKLTEIDRQVIQSKSEITVEEPLHLPNGEIIHYLSKKSPLIDGKGNVIGIVGSSFDLTIEHQEKDSLVEKKKQAEITLEKIISLLPGHVYWKNENGTFLGCNEAQAKFLGLNSPNEFVGKNDYDMYPKEDAAKVVSLDKQIMETGKAYIAEETVRIDNQKGTCYLSQKAPLIGENNKTLGILGISLDITQLKDTEKELEKAKHLAEYASQEKTEFIMALNNIVRSKVNAVAMMVDLLKKSDLNEKQLEYLNLLQEANSEIPDDLVYAADYAKLDSGEIELYPEEFYLLDMVDSMSNTFYRQAQAKDLGFAVDYTGLTDVMLNTSVTQLREIVKIIISHSVEFTQEGGIRLHFSNIDNKSMQIHISDTSPGFMQDYLDNMFSLVEANQTDTEYPKLSMRMAFCKKMLEMMGGTIAVINNKEAGNTFTITLPITSIRQYNQDDIAFEKMVNACRYILITADPYTINTVQSLLKQEALITVAPQAALKTIKTVLDKGDDLDMILIDEPLLRDHPQLLRDIMQLIAKHDVLNILLTDDSATYHPELHNSQQVTRLSKPLKWSRFYKDIVSRWKTYNQRVLRALSVEDDPICQKGLEYVLIDLDCEVVTVGSGEKALSLLADEHNHFDIIILDIGLPGQSGLTIAQAIVQLLDKENCPPLIALTGLTRKVDLDILYDSGLFTAVLEKPATVQDLEDIIEQIKN